MILVFFCSYKQRLGNIILHGYFNKSRFVVKSNGDSRGNCIVRLLDHNDGHGNKKALLLLRLIDMKTII